MSGPEQRAATPRAATPRAATPRVAIVGGGLAGLAAAVALAGRKLDVALFESRRRLGGRATSFRDPASGELVDFCQHVSLGCCTNLADLCRRTGLERFFRRDRVLHFFGPDGRRTDLQAARWLPAPLHLAPALARIGYLTWGEKWRLARGLWRLARGHDMRPDDTIGDWLRRHGQTERIVERFWSVVLVSALGETVDRAAVPPARKVFVDAFLAARGAYELLVPERPLAELFGDGLAGWLAKHGVNVHLGRGVAQWRGDARRATGLWLEDGSEHAADVVVPAVPWRRVRELCPPEMLASLPELDRVEHLEAAPITGVHLWFDRPITPLPHAVLVGTLGQWLFHRGTSPGAAGHYYQIVVSASRMLEGRPRDEVVQTLVGELQQVWPAARTAQLQSARVVSEPAAVFSPRPGVDALRPAQQSSISNLVWAGDWTQTGWPATMEGAVRSGYLAAEAVLAGLGKPARVLADDLPRALLSRWLLSGRATP